jgi:S1-C subfamily serine protease
LPEKQLFPYPHPISIGLILSPREKASVLRVEHNSPAEQAGLQAGDEILSLRGQPLLSIADVQWVLHHAEDGASLHAAVRRDDRIIPLTFVLPKGWRRHDTISWRVSTWALRRMVTGGMVLEELPPEQRKKMGMAPGTMGLLVRYLGQNGPHGAAKQAGFRQGDVLIAFDSKTDLLRETDLIAHALDSHGVGKKVAVKVQRDGKAIELSLPMQE